MKFSATVRIGYDLVVEAEDMYEADDIIRSMSVKEIVAAVSDKRPAFIDRDNFGQFPEPH